MKSLRIGIVGAGVFGGYHAAKVAAHPRAVLSGVQDHSLEKACKLAARHGAIAFETLAELLADSDAVIVACSAKGHGDTALAAIRARKAVLIEKPIAHTIALAEQIVNNAKAANVIIQVGHQERFVARAIGLDQIEEVPRVIRAWRHGPYSDRGTDVSVALDLMTHDMDLVLWLVGLDPLSVSGSAQTVHSKTADRATAHLKFANTEVELSASRVAESSHRVMEIEYESGLVRIDFNAKRLENRSMHMLNPDFGDDPQARDSLGAATDAFIAAVLDGAPVPITGGMGLRALRYAQAATEQVAESKAPAEGED